MLGCQSNHREPMDTDLPVPAPLKIQASNGYDRAVQA